MGKLKIKEDIDIEIKEAYISRESGAILVNYETNKYYETNEIGTRILLLLQKSKPVEEIITTICDEYEVDRNIAFKDFNDFLEKLRKYKLIEE